MFLMMRWSVQLTYSSTFVLLYLTRHDERSPVQVDFSSLIDVRIVKYGKSNSVEQGTGAGGVEVAAGDQNAKSNGSTDNIGEATPGPTKGIYSLHSVDIIPLKLTHLHILMCLLYWLFSKWKGRCVGRNQRGFECKEGTVVSAR